jgi:teichuronic acid biosynthesis glycosyltransferase TuaH
MTATVVIPVHEDAEGLATTLAALGPERVIVVVDGPHGPTEAVARRAGVTVVVLDPAAGSYAARNAGIDQLPADTDVVVFTDAGCVPRPGWVAAHVEALRSAQLSGGAVEVTHGFDPTPAEWVDKCRNLRQKSYVEEGGYAATCNLAVRRDLLRQIRFDATLQSGGDREFCARAGRLGAQLVYTPDAVVEHSARTTTREVLAKARRVGKGIASLPPESRPVPPRVQRPNLGLLRRARAAGLPAGPVWGLRVAWLDHRRARVLRDEALRPAPVDGLHVVVLLASRWSSLETMNTRWRQVVQAWAQHPGVARVTLVDHPRFRPRARELVRPETSWLPGVELLDLTVPTTLRPSRLDRLGWRRAGRALEAALPPAQRRLVVSTSSVSTPLLPHLQDGTTTCAFDAVDVWRNLAVSGDLGARLADGYRALDAATTLTSVSVPIAESLRRWTAKPVAVVPNGVELAAYSEPRPAPAGLPDEPFAVYVGSLSSRLDVELTAQVAALLADEIPVVLAGPADAPTAERIDGTDLVWLGPVPTDLVPGLLQRAAVGLFPHRRTDITEAADSMKLLEYAAAGLPVVSTELPGLPPGVLPAAGALDFAEAVRREAARPRRPARPWVLDRDWSVVADKILHDLLAAPADVTDASPGVKTEVTAS